MAADKNAPRPDVGIEDPSGHLAHACFQELEPPLPQRLVFGSEVLKHFCWVPTDLFNPLVSSSTEERNPFLLTFIFLKMGHSRLFLYFCLFYYTIGIINFAYVCIRTADLWCQKRPTYQLSHNLCPNVIFFHSLIHPALVRLALGQMCYPKQGTIWIGPSVHTCHLLNSASVDTIVSCLFDSCLGHR